MPGPLRFNRHDRAATAVLAIALLLGFLFVFFWKGDERTIMPPTDRQASEMRGFASHADDTSRNAVRPGKEIRASLSRFNPNTADSARLVRLGLPSFVAANIVKYRRAGGKFRRPSDLARIYGMSQDDYRRIAPYIDIVEAVPGPAPARMEVYRSNKLHEGETVDLNCGDTSQLKRVPGVGSVLARRIVKYGNLLGGYVSPAQVAEVYGISPDAVKWFRTDNAAPHKVNLNTAAYGEMLRHPYLNKPQVEAVMRRRRTLGKISDIGQMRFDSAFTERDIQRLAPYVDF